MGLFSYSPSLGNWHLTAEKRGRARPVPSCGLGGETKKLYHTLLKAWGMNKTLLFSGGSSCCGCVGAPKTQRISAAAATCNEADKRVKVWDNTANLWRNEDLCEETQTLPCHLGCPDPPVNHPGSSSLGQVSKTFTLRSFWWIQTVGVTGTWPQHIAPGLAGWFWADRNMAAALTGVWAPC